MPNILNGVPLNRLPENSQKSDKKKQIEDLAQLLIQKKIDADEAYEIAEFMVKISTRAIETVDWERSPETKKLEKELISKIQKLLNKYNIICVQSENGLLIIDNDKDISEYIMSLNPEDIIKLIKLKIDNIEKRDDIVEYLDKMTSGIYSLVSGENIIVRYEFDEQELINDTLKSDNIKLTYENLGSGTFKIVEIRDEEYKSDNMLLIRTDENGKKTLLFSDGSEIGMNFGKEYIKKFDDIEIKKTAGIIPLYGEIKLEGKKYNFGLVFDESMEDIDEIYDLTPENNSLNYVIYEKPISIDNLSFN